MKLLNSKKRWLALAAAAAVAVAVVWSVWVVIGDDEDADEPTTVAATASPSAIPHPPLALPEPALPERIVIPEIDVDAPISVKALDSTGMMQPPNGPEDVAWYEFTARPGSTGNAVLSGHVDYHDYGPAVFARLKDLKPGDALEVRLVDSTVYAYRIVLAVTYPAAEAPFEDIVGPTAQESLTLITCTGTFDPASRQYSHRLVVRAERT